jgi:hypothetical protein
VRVIVAQKIGLCRHDYDLLDLVSVPQRIAIEASGMKSCRDDLTLDEEKKAFKLLQITCLVGPYKARSSQPMLRSSHKCEKCFFLVAKKNCYAMLCYVRCCLFTVNL